MAIVGNAGASEKAVILAGNKGKASNMPEDATTRLLHLKRASKLVIWKSGLIYIQGVSKKSRQFRNGSQPREAASSMKFFVNIDCLGTCDVE